jgi:hypothetical protein
MQRFYILFFVLALTCLFLDSCRKKEKDNTEVTFVNSVNAQVTLDIYKNATDYSNAAPVMLRKSLQPNESTILPGSTFAAGQTYYMDWYTDDYRYNNWFNDNYSQGQVQVAFKPVAGNNTYYLRPQFKNINRIVYLNKTANSTKWKAIGAYTKSTEYIAMWSLLPEHERFRELTLKKGFTASYDYKNTSGTVVTDQLDFFVHNSERAYIEFVKNGQTEGQMISGELPTGTPPNYTSTATDTIMALLPNSDYYFMMVRQ